MACVYVCRLLDLLADRRDKAGKTGRILLNGKRRPSNYKRAVGYVVQVESHTKSIISHYSFPFWFRSVRNRIKDLDIIWQPL